VDLVISKGSLSWWNKCFRLHIVAVQMKVGYKQDFKGDICKKDLWPIPRIHINIQRCDGPARTSRCQLIELKFGHGL
jgi:hypothetical protein